MLPNSATMLMMGTQGHAAAMIVVVHLIACMIVVLCLIMVIVVAHLSEGRSGCDHQRECCPDGQSKVGFCHVVS
jgi:hypothetical protein